MLTSTTSSIALSSPYVNASRIQALDLQRGIIMIIMALSHCSEYVAASVYTHLNWDTSATWAGSSFLDFFELFLVTSVAPGFFMLMGAGILFFHHARLKDGWSESKICRFLLLRGLLLVLLQLTLLQAFEIVAERTLYFYAGVLLTLGLCMMAAALLVFLSQQVKRLALFKTLPVLSLLSLFSIALIITLSQNMIDDLHQGSLQASLWHTLFFLSGEYAARIPLDINFTPWPWFPTVAFGLLLGQGLVAHKEKAFNYIGLLALSFFLAWFSLRYANLHQLFTFGSYKTVLPGEAITATTYFDMAKFPPSLTYFLWTLACNLAGIFILSRLPMQTTRLQQLLQPLTLFGQCALFFFVAHWFIYYGLSQLLPTRLTSSLGVCAMWITGLVLLYPLCKVFNAFKLQQPKASLWRLF